MCEFYNYLKQKYNIKQKIILVGHSLDGYLAQYLARTHPDLIKEIYAFQAPGLKLSHENHSCTYKNFYINTTHYLNLKYHKWWNFNFVQKLYQKDGVEIILYTKNIKYHPSVYLYKLEEFFHYMNNSINFYLMQILI